MGMRTAVIGASGYAGGELLRLLDCHPTIEVTTLVAAGNAGRSLGEVHPQLTTLADRVLLDSETPQLADAEVVFLAMPHGTSAAMIPALAPDAIVVDLGADFRLADPAAWQRWYSG